MDSRLLIGKLKPFENKREMLSPEQSTGDIIAAILKAHEFHKDDYKNIAGYFQAGSKRDVGRKIYNFLKNNVKYVIEPSTNQTVKSPSAILATGYGDCKHYSLFAGGILSSLKIPFAYRFASYRAFDKQPQHVFVVIDPDTSHEIWIDPVLSKFDLKKPYNYSIDKKMALYQISGIGATAQQKAALKAAKAAKKAAPTKTAKKAAKVELKAARKAAERTAGQVLKKGTKVVLKVAASPARNAFLALVALNFGGLATKLSAAWKKAPSKIQNFWDGIGGKTEALKKAWEKGEKKKRIFGYGEIGFAPAAGAAAAAPILVKVTEVLKNIGIDPAELVQIGKDALNQKAQQLAKKALEPKAENDAADLAVADTVFESERAVETKKMNYLPLIIGGGAILYFATRK